MKERQKPRVLVAENDPGMQYLLVRTLGGMYDIITAKNPRDIRACLGEYSNINVLIISGTCIDEDEVILAEMKRVNECCRVILFSGSFPNVCDRPRRWVDVGIPKGDDLQALLYNLEKLTR